MWHSIAANLIVVFHFGFVLFVVAGGFLVLKWRWVAFLHIPAAVWGVLIEFMGWGCPLTPLEQNLRMAAGQAGYSGGFLEHYLGLLIYPPALTRALQIGIGVFVIAINVVIYSRVMARWRKGKAS